MWGRQALPHSRCPVGAQAEFRRVMQRQQADEEIVGGTGIPAEVGHDELCIRLLSNMLDNNLISNLGQVFPVFQCGFKVSCFWRWQAVIITATSTISDTADKGSSCHCLLRAIMNPISLLSIQVRGNGEVVNIPPPGPNIYALSHV